MRIKQGKASTGELSRATDSTKGITLPTVGSHSTNPFTPQAQTPEKAQQAASAQAAAGAMVDTAQNLHQEAMKHAARAIVARFDGSLDEAADLTRKALDCETEAANQLPIMPESEPLRASLFNRAAWLAFSIGDYERAFQLADEGLDGFVPTIELEVDLLFIRQLARRE